MAKKLSICIPQYHETDEVIKPLLDSIEMQRQVNMGDIEVIIVNDGTDVKLSELLLSIYSYEIKYIQAEHGGVSAARDRAFREAKGDYVCFCDADDQFWHCCAFYMLFMEMAKSKFDALTSVFLEESKHPGTGQILYVPHEIDYTFVHGKVYRRQFLIDNGIYWNHDLTIHEDSFYECLALKIAGDKAVYCAQPFYLWCWNPDSVCRHDPKYILKTYNNMLDSNTALVNEFLRRERPDDAEFYAVSMIMDAYYTMNEDAWISQDNQEYRKATELRFKKYWRDFKKLFDGCDKDVKMQITAGIRQRKFTEGLGLESVTFREWIKHIEELEESNGDKTQ